MTAGDVSDLSIDDARVEVEKAWRRLMTTVEQGARVDITGKRDDRGWSALDHLAHVVAWERSRLAWLQGFPRYQGLGVTPEQFELGYDDLNEIVREQTSGQEYEEIIAAARNGHQAMVTEIQSFDPADVPQSGGISRDEIARVGDLLRENVADHYDEHRVYIERILVS